MTARLPLLLLSLSALSTVSACATSLIGRPPENSVPTIADNHRITVEQTGTQMNVEVDPADTALSDKARENIAAFASSYLRVGHGALIMSTPSGGDNANAAGSLAQQVRLSLTDSGVPYPAIAGATYDASGTTSAPIILSFARFEAHAPQCAPLWTQDIAHQDDNQPWASFGCSAQANLAAMIEDPHDLIDPRGDAPRDSGRRDAVMAAYRQGHPTATDRTDAERAAISTVAP